MRFGLVYRRPFSRSDSMMVDAPDMATALSTRVDLDPSKFFAEHLIDFEERKVIKVALTSEGKLIEVPEGEFGEATSSEYFEELAQQEPAGMEA
jgi:hypothetical protein